MCWSQLKAAHKSRWADSVSLFPILCLFSQFHNRIFSVAVESVYSGLRSLFQVGIFAQLLAPTPAKCSYCISSLYHILSFRKHLWTPTYDSRKALGDPGSSRAWRSGDRGRVKESLVIIAKHLLGNYYVPPSIPSIRVFVSFNHCNGNSIIIIQFYLEGKHAEK